MWYKIGHEKDTYLQYESWNKKAEHCLFNLSWEHLHWAQFFTTLSLSANDHESTVNTDFRVVMNFSKLANLQIWNPWMTDSSKFTYL